MSKIALYIRLSVEDQIKVNDSESIINQRRYLNDFLDNNDELKSIKRVEYVDDGYSGTNENRPAYQRLLEDIKNGEVKCIIVKDMSRFLRDYITLGDYLENIFPFLGIRFISINDSYDSVKENGNGTDIDVQFKNLMYDFYSKDASVKMKATKTSLSRQGKVMSWNPPYGYMKDPHNKYKIIIDEEVAWVVRKIYELAIEGLSLNNIARYLNAEKIAVPSIRKKQLTNMDYGSRYKETQSKTWLSGTVGRILRNETYTGTYVFNKNERSVFTGKRNIRRPKEEWEKVYDNHEAIISIEDFKKVRDIHSKRARKIGTISKNFPHRQHSPLQGFVRCPNCNHILSCQKIKRQTKTKGEVSYRRFYCRVCRVNAVKIKGSSADIIEHIVLKAIKDRYGVIRNNKGGKVVVPSYEKELKNLELIKQSLYESYKLGNKTRLDFIEEKQKIDNKIDEFERLQLDRETIGKKEAVFDECLTSELIEKYIESVLVIGNEVKEIKWK